MFLISLNITSTALLGKTTRLPFRLTTEPASFYLSRWPFNAAKSTFFFSIEFQEILKILQHYENQWDNEHGKMLQVKFHCRFLSCFMFIFFCYSLEAEVFSLVINTKQYGNFSKMKKLNGHGNAFRWLRIDFCLTSAEKLKSSVCLESLWKFSGHFESTPILDVMNLNESFQTRSFVDFDLV